MSKILMIEDETKIARFVELELQHEGYEVKSAYDGRSGLSLCESWQPDLLILDLMLPELSGIEVCRRLRQQSDIPIIMCYNLPVLSAILKNPDARALYLFPTKALSADQASELYDLVEALGVDIKAYTYDGDTQGAARKAIRQAGHIVVTNPDMLHSNVLPNHTKWVKLFENLQYIVIDEIHTYRGVFGSNLANVLRRLLRLCAFYGSHPRFILCSATIANPQELAHILTGREILTIDNNGSPMVIPAAAKNKENAEKLDRKSVV